MKVSVVIPAYNEERTIAGVVEAALRTPLVSEVVVVNDASLDNTAEEACRKGARVITCRENLGKGGAMLLGATVAGSEVILFLDADLLGLTPSHLESLIKPILNGRADMTVGVFEHGRVVTDLAQVLAPYLSGQRALFREMLFRITNLSQARYGAEVIMSLYASEARLRVEEIILSEVSHVMKEEKMGLVKGLQARARMYWEIARTAAAQQRVSR